MKDKRALRIACKQRRKALSPQARAEKSRLIATHAEMLLKELLPFPALALYDPMPEEADIRALFRWCETHHITAALPCVETPHSPLVFKEWREGEALAPHPGLPFLQPEGAMPVVVPEVVFVPVTGFNAQGARIGQGGGYYDRTLAGLRQGHHRCIAIGIAFACQQVAEAFAETHDQPLDYLITEEQRFDFTK